MKFTPNEPIKTRESSIVVDAGMPVGSYTFQLVVVNDRGRESEPATVVVRITDERSGTGTLTDTRNTAILVDSTTVFRRL